MSLSLLKAQSVVILCVAICAVVTVTFANSSPAYAGGPSGSIYTDSLQNGWQSWPWAKTVKLDNGSPVHSGSKSILVVGKGWDALSINRMKASSTGFKSLSFWVYASGPSAQPLKVVGLTDNKAQNQVVLAPLAPKSWRHVSIPLSELGVANKPNLTGFWLQDAGGKGLAIVVDDIALVP
jgi:hypothetical protein